MPNPIQSEAAIVGTPCSEDADRLRLGAAANYPERGDNPFSGLEELKALRGWFNQNPSDAKGWRALNALLEETIKKTGIAGSSPKFTDEEIRTAASLESLSWKNEAEVWWKPREQSIHAELRRQGVTSLPYPVRELPSGGQKGGKGNRATNAWRSCPVPSNETPAESADAISDEITYVQEGPDSIQLTGWLRRMHFKHGQIRRDSLRFKLLRWRALASALGLIAFSAVVFLRMIFSNGTALTAADVATLLAALGGFWVWWDNWKPLHLASADRIAIIPPEWLKDEAPPAQIERRKTENGEVLRLVRYSAVCPICGAQVWLGSGAPEWPRRVFGRCSDAPREHVLTFDPVTLRGRPIRQSP